ncbi:hypothetical protein [Microbacterium esteraromaticum]|uniref:hypothetical protein n=1 Tax=Microbacterium esteraromaticum TaxID=57043 RepID=UPI000B34D944|nr:hypothetical protein [Microbacterium esteraromaticum]
MAETGFTDYEAIIRVFDGMKLSNSNYADDAVSSLLRDPVSNTLETHAPIFLKDASEEGMKKVAEAVKDLPTGTKVILLAGAVVVISGAVVVGKNWESIRSWSVGAISRLRPQKALVSRVSDIEAVEIDIEPSARMDLVDSPTEVEIAEKESAISLTSAQWRQLLQGALTLSSWEEQIWLVLCNAAIEDGDEKVLEWQRQMRELTPDEAAASVRGMIEQHPELKDDQAVAELIKIVVRRLGETDGDPKSLDL